MNINFGNLERKLGYSFKKKEVLVKALTHVSKSKVNNGIYSNYVWNYYALAIWFFKNLD